MNIPIRDPQTRNLIANYKPVFAFVLLPGEINCASTSIKELPFKLFSHYVRLTRRIENQTVCLVTHASHRRYSTVFFILDVKTALTKQVIFALRFRDKSFSIQMKLQNCSISFHVSELRTRQRTCLSMKSSPHPCPQNKILKKP